MEKKGDLKERKKGNPFKIIAVVAIGIIVIVALVAYMGGRDAIYTEEGESVIEETYYEPEGMDGGIDECKEHCIDCNAEGYDWEEDYCRCWFDIEEDECESHCDSWEADGFDQYENRFREEDYCRCWFEMRGRQIKEPFVDSIWIPFLPIVLMAFTIWFITHLIRRW